MTGSNVTVNNTDIIVLLILGILFLLGVRVVISFFRKPTTPIASQDMNTVCKAGSRLSVSIDGMMCGMCEIHVKDALRKAMPDARNITASHEQGKAEFVLGTTKTIGEIDKVIRSFIDPLGYRIVGVYRKKGHIWQI